MDISTLTKAIPAPIKTYAVKTGAKISAYSPEILLVGGIAGIIGGTILACRATLKADEVLDEFAENKDTIEAAAALNDETYSETDYKRDTAINYVGTAKDFLVLYAPAIACTGLGIACVMTSHGIMTKRNMALTAAANTIQSAFTAYRKNVTTKYGAEIDRDMRFGLVDAKETSVITDENGKTKKVKTPVKTFNPDDVSVYCRWYSKETSHQFINNPDYNRAYLISQQSRFTNILNARGYLFLNEVYDELGLPQSKAGQIVGWCKNSDGDGFVDFGITEARNAHAWNGDYEDGINAYLLDFNVDGPITDCLKTEF